MKDDTGPSLVRTATGEHHAGVVGRASSERRDGTVETISPISSLSQDVITLTGLSSLM